MLSLAAFASQSLVISPVAVAPPRAAVRTLDAEMAMPKWAQSATAFALAAAVTVAPVDAAFAAKSGGRVGGRVSSSSPSGVKSTAPKAASSTAASSTTPKAATSTATAPAATTTAPAAPQVTNVYMTQPMGYGYGYGGYGMGGGGGGGMGLLIGVELANAFIKAQERQAYLQQQLKVQQQLGADSAQIQELQRQLAEQTTRQRAVGAESRSSARPLAPPSPRRPPQARPRPSCALR